MDKYWAERKSEWFKGGYVWVYELMKRYYLWEVEPMCDSFNKCVESCGEWRIIVKRSYSDGKRTETCHEAFADAEGLSEAAAMALYDKVMSGEYRLPALKDMFEDAMYTAEAVRLMP